MCATRCKICSSKVKSLFSKTLLGTYKVAYYQCEKCGFLQTEEPYWLEEAYKSGAISALDTGILYRNINLRHRTQTILQRLFSEFNDFYALDYGGGEGIFVRMMRDSGYNFYRHDLFADNLYARFFDLKDVPRGTRFDILTAFEVFEHLANPLAEIKKMLEYSDILLFSTELQPAEDNLELKDWWYLVPETGQHISFYNQTSLEKIADLLDLNFYTDQMNLHILSKTPLIDPFKANETENTKANLAKRLIDKLYNKFSKVQSNQMKTQVPPSLTMKDFELVKKKLNKED